MDEPNLGQILHVLEARAYWKIRAVSSNSSVGVSEKPKFGDVEKKRAGLWSHVAEEFAFHGTSSQGRRWWRGVDFLGLHPGRTSRCPEEELFRCFGDSGPVDGDGGGSGRYKAEKARIAHFFRGRRRGDNIRGLESTLEDELAIPSA